MPEPTSAAVGDTDTALGSITLHSDGYANDPSSNSETRTIEALVGGWQELPVFVNTIAYRGEYAQTRGQLAELASAKADKQCATESKFSSGRAVF